MSKLTPTARLILLVLRDQPAPVDQTDLINLTGATPSALIPAVRTLVRSGHLDRLPGKRAFYQLPASVTEVL